MGFGTWFYSLSSGSKFLFGLSIGVLLYLGLRWFCWQATKNWEEIQANKKHHKKTFEQKIKDLTGE
jgi:CHASE3 domain sensor protein